MFRLSKSALNYNRINIFDMPSSPNLSCYHPIPSVKLPWLFPETPLKFNGAPGIIQGHLTGMLAHSSYSNAKVIDVSSPFFLGYGLVHMYNSDT